MARPEGRHEQAEVREDWREEADHCNQRSLRRISRGVQQVPELCSKPGFEDTPDYDYLRDLFTQALKNTGEVEDGEYDWMKLNNGKGWEAMKQHPHMLHQPNAVPGASQRELHGTPRAGNSTPGHLTAARLNAAQPPPPSPIKAGMGKTTRDRPSAQGGLAPKRSSGAAGGLQDVATPTGSTQAQFQNSSNNLPQRMMPQPNMNTQVQNGRTSEPQLSGFQKLMKTICCG